MNRKNIENLTIICLITVFMGQIYLNPVSENFRFTLAPIALSILLIYFRETSVKLATSLIAVLMFLFRSLVYYIGHPDVAVAEVMVQYLPVIIYYLLYGMLFTTFRIREKLDTAKHLILLLWICDSAGNIAEAFIRGVWKGIAFEKAVLVTILIGLIRAVFTYLIILLVKRYQSRFEREQREQKFKELMLFTAKLKSELFFLKKSMSDIESTMNESYFLYNALQDPGLKEHALNVSRNIHEIKKDYYRVVVGMEKTLEEDKTDLCMSIDEILSIIGANTEKLIADKGKNIVFDCVIEHHFQMQDYYPLISILNNMIINAVDAIESRGKIRVGVRMDQDDCIIDVFDNGHGIESDELELIFKPGYSGKIDMETGKFSTGLGLAHVQYIIENHYGGDIKASSYLNEYTNFELKIPRIKLEEV
ncbi:MAG: sensor histidine kinase [Clostridia bacterium]|nr:sensor histidine kinase [Clostridia bacterium]